jgi:hypothetical protein
MMKPMLLAVLIFLTYLDSSFAQSPQAAGPSLQLLEDRIDKLSRELDAYKRNYAALDKLFWETLALLEGLYAAGTNLLRKTHDTVAAARTVEAEIDRTVAESREVIEYLKTKVAERPILLITGEAAWHIPLGAAAGAYLSWEPLPWLGMKAGAELWYTDAFHPAFPLVLTLRFGLD